MGWDLSTWLAMGRCVQLLGSLIATASHGYLTIQIHKGRLGLSKEMVVLEFLACVMFGYSIFALALQRKGRRPRKTSWMTGFVICDIVLCMALLVVVNMLARAGLPDHCGGITRHDFLPGDAPNKPEDGYTTIRFSDEASGRRGHLDQFCSLERAYYVVANALMYVSALLTHAPSFLRPLTSMLPISFTYMFTVTATILRVLETKYTKNTKVHEMLESLERAEAIQLKILDASPSPLPRHREPQAHSHPPPLSEGIITRTASLRSTRTAATSVAGSHNPYAYAMLPNPRRNPAVGTMAIPRRGIPPPAGRPSSPTPSTTTTGSTAIMTQPSTPPPPFSTLPHDQDAAAAAALVADGMQHRPHHHHHHPSQHQQHIYHHRHYLPPGMPMLSEEVPLPGPKPGPSPSSSSSSSSPTLAPSYSAPSYHSDEEDPAAAALVSDGMRHTRESSLPPYQPRQQGSGEMRLSGFGKGQER
ncbi:hypothetical protein VTJ49DRAFT_4494 [Mycothermus thermophilus]|uniref:Uncharacterized protein n=1 Tax=Humicola insolens TaxID=85995 RepID=A0ABR3V5A1_HUMIN